MKTRAEYNAASLARFREKGGKIVYVRMTAEQFNNLDRFRLPNESVSGCVHRLITAGIKETRRACQALEPYTVHVPACWEPEQPGP
jgi:hypothetical protein